MKKYTDIYSKQEQDNNTSIESSPSSSKLLQESNGAIINVARYLAQVESFQAIRKLNRLSVDRDL
jgi:hypothetical protein